MAQAATATAAEGAGKGMLWAGRIFTALPALMLLASGAMKLARPPAVMEGFVGKFGYPAGAVVPIGVLELACVVLYLVPRTAVIGAILLTGYLGGAVATHVRVSDAFVAPLLVGVAAWAGLFFRDERVRRLIPFRQD